MKYTAQLGIAVSAAMLMLAGIGCDHNDRNTDNENHTTLSSPGVDHSDAGPSPTNAAPIDGTSQAPANTAGNTPANPGQ